MSLDAVDTGDLDLGRLQQPPKWPLQPHPAAAAAASSSPQPPFAASHSHETPHNSAVGLPIRPFMCKKQMDIQPGQTITINGRKCTPPVIADGRLEIASLVTLEYHAAGRSIDHPSPTFFFWRHRRLQKGAAGNENENENEADYRFMRCVECGLGLPLNFVCTPRTQSSRWGIGWMLRHASVCHTVDFNSEFGSGFCPRCEARMFDNHQALRAHFRRCPPKGLTKQPAAAQPPHQAVAKKTKRKAQSTSNSEVAAAASAKRKKGGAAAASNSEADG